MRSMPSSRADVDEVSASPTRRRHLQGQGVVEINQAVVAVVDKGFFDMARGGGRFHFAEGAVAQKRT